jgi:hypothetical protein
MANQSFLLVFVFQNEGSHQGLSRAKSCTGLSDASFDLLEFRLFPFMVSRFLGFFQFSGVVPKNCTQMRASFFSERQHIRITLPF